MAHQQQLNQMRARQQQQRNMQTAWNQAQPKAAMETAWAKAAASAPAQPMDAAWKEATAGEQWAEEFRAEQEQQRMAGTSEHDMAATRRTTAEMVNVLSQNDDPRFQNSEFLSFMKQVSSGDVTFKGNEVVAGEGSQGLQDAWTEAVASKPVALEETWKEVQHTRAPTQLDAAWTAATAPQPVQTVQPAAAPATAAQNSLPTEAEQQLAIDAALDNAWGDAMENNFLNFDGGADMTPEQLEAVWNNAMTSQMGEFDQVWNEGGLADPAQYMFTDENSYMKNSSAFEDGMRLFREGNTHEAILAFEADAQQHPENSECWRMLGIAHQENDEDKKAIMCLEKAVENDPYNLEALLALGVSYVNELDSEKALQNLKSWVENNPKFQGMKFEADAYSDGSLMDEVMQLMQKANQWEKAQDPDVHEVLGVLYNVSRDYDSAVKAFKNAVNFKPDDYSLWNKLGATLANSNRSEEAMPAYHRALELKPKYARGLLNLGISHANMGNYQEAARSYLGAIKLNPKATHIWSYLRIAFSCLERYDLVTKAEAQDVYAFRDEFQF